MFGLEEESAERDSDGEHKFEELLRMKKGEALNKSLNTLRNGRAEAEVCWLINLISSVIVG